MADITESFHPTHGFIEGFDRVLRWVWDVTVDETLSATNGLTRADIEPLLERTGQAVSLEILKACDAALYRLRPGLGRGVIVALALALHDIENKYNSFDYITAEQLRAGRSPSTTLVGTAVTSEKAIYANSCTLLPEARTWLQWDLQRAHARVFTTIAHQYGEMVAVDIETLRTDNVFQTLPVEWHAHKGSHDKFRGEVVTFGLPAEAVEGPHRGRVIGVDPLAKCYGFDDAWLVALKLGADPTVATSVAWTILQAAAVAVAHKVPAITAWGALESDLSKAPEFLLHGNTRAVMPTPESMWAAARPILIPWLRAYQAAKVDSGLSPVDKSTKLTLKARSIPEYWRRSSLIIYDGRSLPAVPDVFARDENNSVLAIRPDGFTIHSPGDPDVSDAVTWMPTGEETRALVRDSIGQWHAVHLPQPDMLERA